MKFLNSSILFSAHNIIIISRLEKFSISNFPGNFPLKMKEARRNKLKIDRIYINCERTLQSTLFSLYRLSWLYLVLPWFNYFFKNFYNKFYSNFKSIPRNGRKYQKSIFVVVLMKDNNAIFYFFLFRDSDSNIQHKIKHEKHKKNHSESHLLP